ncbi:hypothetical protein FRB93_004764 [Tulasnella sp. JGI-2019a]|nr:hypothetical protein FRB93_004764 [Tulasnella sp. JGI-2019a]
MLTQFLSDKPAVTRALHDNQTVVCATTASLISTLSGYPLDSLKSRLQTSREHVSVPRMAAIVYKEEGVAGFFRGIWIPLITISVVRAASFSIYTGTKIKLHENDLLNRPRVLDVSLGAGLGGAMSGALISVGSTPFELVKIRRQLEYSIAAAKNIKLEKPPGTYTAVREIVNANGFRGLFQGFRLHFWRDLSGSALYFGEYEAMRHLLGRDAAGIQGHTPSWAPIPPSLIPFACGSLAGVTSWALIYPLDVVKTKVQQRALAGAPARSAWVTLVRLLRGPDPSNPRTIVAGVGRIYQGLGVSAARSVLTHGFLWTIYEYVKKEIDALP